MSISINFEVTHPQTPGYTSDSGIATPWFILTQVGLETGASALVK